MSRRNGNARVSRRQRSVCCSLREFFTEARAEGFEPKLADRDSPPYCWQEGCQQLDLRKCSGHPVHVVRIIRSHSRLEIGEYRLREVIHTVPPDPPFELVKASTSKERVEAFSKAAGYNLIPIRQRQRNGHSKSASPRKRRRSYAPVTAGDSSR